MRLQPTVSRSSLLLALLLLAYPADAQAYIDAGTGSVIINAVLASVMGGFFFFRHHLRRLKNRLFGGSSEPTTEATGAQTSEPPKS